MTDPISDMLTRRRNARLALVPEVEVSQSRMKESIANILKNEGYIAGCPDEGKTPRKLKLKLKYQGRKGVIIGLKRVSKPGLRRYGRATEIPRVLGGIGTAIASNTRSVMTAPETR